MFRNNEKAIVFDPPRLAAFHPGDRPRATVGAMVSTLMNKAIQLAPGEALVLNCLRAAFGQTDPVQPHDVAEPVLYDAVRIAMQNVVLNVMGEGLSGGLDAVGTQETRRRQAEYWAVTTSRNSAILSHAADITAALDAAGIPHVYFKGPLQQLQHHGTAFLRPCGDLDMLVRSRDVTRAGEVLAQAGHVPHEGLSLWWLPFLGERHFTAADGRCVIDLHRTVQQPGLPQPKGLAGFIDRAERLPVGSGSLPVLSAVDQQIVLACNIAKALFTRSRSLAQVCDLTVSLGPSAESGPAAFEEACRRHGIAGTGALALDAVAALFGPEAASRSPGASHAFAPACLLRPILNPREARNWPRRRAVSAAACDHRAGVRARVGLWFLASEATRRASSHRGAAKPADRPAA